MYEISNCKQKYKYIKEAKKTRINCAVVEKYGTNKLLLVAVA